MNAIPCETYVLDMKAAQFGNCNCGFSKGAHGLGPSIQTRKITNPNVGVVNESSGKQDTPCVNFQLDMKAETFGMCICGHLKISHGTKKNMTESQTALKTLGSDRTAMKAQKKAERVAKEATERATKEPTQGWVSKRGQIMPTWKKRWFIFEDGILAYKTRQGGIIKGQLMISDCLVTTQENGLGFAVTIPGRTMRCKCANKEDATKWVSVLRGETEPNNLPVSNEDAESKTTTSKKKSGGKKNGRNNKPKLEFGEEEHQLLDEKTSCTLIKSASVNGNVLKFEVAHRHVRDLYFTIDINGSENLKLKDSLAGKRTQTVKPEYMTLVGLVTVVNPMKGWNLNVKYGWEVEMAP